MEHSAATAAAQSRRQLTGAILAIAAVQLIFWLVVQPLLFARTDPPEFLEIRHPAYARLAEPSRAGMAAAQ